MKARGEAPPSEAAPSPPAAAPVEPAAPAPAAGGGGKYVPRHLRGAADGAAPPRGESMTDGWRGSSQRGREDGASGSKLGVPSRPNGTDRSVSPANGPSMGGRSFSGRGDAPPERTESPAAQPATGGKYRPGAFRRGGGAQ